MAPKSPSTSSRGRKKKEAPEEQPTMKDQPEAIAEEPVDIIVPVEAVPGETVPASVVAPPAVVGETWTPKTLLGKQVRQGTISSVKAVFESGHPILETQIVDLLLPNLQSDLLLIGQSKGKFGGGQRRVFKQTQKKTKEGNKPNFATCAVVGDKNGIVGVGYGKAKETVPAREKAFRKAKLNIFPIRRGCGSWQCGCKEPHSIPFKVEGKCGSLRLELSPAPKGTGLTIQKECQKVLALAGIKDVWSNLEGHSASTYNVIEACVEALHQLLRTKIPQDLYSTLGIVDGQIGEQQQEKTAEEVL